MRLKLKKADKLFSRYIRERDMWICQRCGTRYNDNPQGLHCSHYFGRARFSTRFDPDNCVALCYGCHRLWGHGDQRDQYQEYMERKLGKEGFKRLTLRANMYAKADWKAAEIYSQHLLNTLHDQSLQRGKTDRPRKKNKTGLEARA